MALFLCRRHIGRRYRLLTAVSLSRNIEPLLPDGYSDSLEMQYSSMAVVNFIDFSMWHEIRVALSTRYIAFKVGIFSLTLFPPFYLHNVIIAQRFINSIQEYYRLIW